MDQILPNLYLGSLIDGRMAAQHESPVCHVVNLCEYTYYPEKTPVSHAPFPDEQRLPAEHWQRLVLMLEGLLVTTTVLVHCRLGVSRSPALLATYLAKLQDTTPWIALRMIQKKRPIAAPHRDTWAGVMDWWQRYGNGGYDA